ncbi:hypothetical protein SELSPUOL_02166 [Selenomonas sputigena ATCC 35185]|uniref:Uncharacterized protein n=1 Tax=Selenomonas sputigena (strain ATCC 35185 / DSM 20758 / CCUG 44933 / VPI D19B-28) TaxID=546271 RepID=C9LXF8_SELS3|nr:hypothetical protein SELSPUOL_02166 [Selenomonas sputigena ATCC 35185]
MAMDGKCFCAAAFSCHFQEVVSQMHNTLGSSNGRTIFCKAKRIISGFVE